MANARSPEGSLLAVRVEREGARSGASPVVVQPAMAGAED